MQALRRAVVGHRPVAYPGAHGLHPRMGGPAEVWLMCEAQRPGKLRLAGGVRGVHANTMRVEDAKKAAKLQGGITQKSAEDATFQQSGAHPSGEPSPADARTNHATRLSYGPPTAVETPASAMSPAEPMLVSRWAGPRSGPVLTGRANTEKSGLPMPRPPRTASGGEARSRHRCLRGPCPRGSSCRCPLRERLRGMQATC